MRAERRADDIWAQSDEAGVCEYSVDVHVRGASTTHTCALFVMKSSCAKGELRPSARRDRGAAELLAAHAQDSRHSDGSVKCPEASIDSM